jgi:tetratricopeptide (TPR) repeat protein
MTSLSEFCKENNIKEDFLTTSSLEELKELGHISKLNDNWEVSDLIYSKILESEDKNFGALTSKGITLYQLGKYDDAIEFCNKALEIPEGEHAIPITVKGDSLFQQGKYDDAIACYDEIIKKRRVHIHALHNKILALVKTKGQNEALQVWPFATRWSQNDEKIAGLFNTIKNDLDNQRETKVGLWEFI